MIHFSKIGLKWIVDSRFKFKRVPFLLTNDLTLEHIFSKDINLTPSFEAETSFIRFPDSNFAILSEQSIGNLSTKDGQFHIDIFSNKKIGKSDILKEEFCFAGFTDVIGKISFTD